MPGREPALQRNESAPVSPVLVAIVDDHQVLVDALRMVIQTQKDLAVTGTGGSCAECLELVHRNAPQVLLLDVRLPDGDGIELVPTIKMHSPETNILILTSLSDEETLMRAMQVGVSGFVSKSRNLSEVLQAIRQAAAGEIAIPTGLLLGLLNRTPRDNRAIARGRDTLTPREREILILLARGKKNEEIAAALTIAPLTVRTHIRNMLKKLGMTSRLQAVTYALKYGLIVVPV
jgi:two-component system, NarL family, nitrate/nitrite response regulator NarL